MQIAKMFGFESDDEQYITTQTTSPDPNPAQLKQNKHSMKWPALVSAEQLEKAKLTAGEVEFWANHSLDEGRQGEYVNYERLAENLNQAFRDKLENE